MTNRPPNDIPEPLVTADATDFERRLLHAAREERPSAASSARMAKRLGIAAAAATVTLPVAAAKALVAEAAAAKAAAGAATAGAATIWPWVSVGVVGLAIAGAVIGTRASSPARPAPPALTAPRALTAPTPPSPPPAVAAPTRELPVAPDHRKHAATGDLADQIALLDAARAAVSAGANRRAMETLRRYEDRYPRGSFRPEVTALKVEALVKLGRDDEARALAERFVAQNRGSLLARRVAALAGVAP
jgi:hypothetical protein